MVDYCNNQALQSGAGMHASPALRINGNHMSAREDLIAAAKSLLAQGVNHFTLAEIMNEARKLGSNYADATLRTMVTQHLRIDKRIVTGGTGFVMADRGLYRLESTAEGKSISLSANLVSALFQTQRDETRESNSVDGHEWFWEGNIQAALVRHLAADGWRIRRVADTHSREHGIDVEADRNGISLLVEVKGYPSATYRNGPKEGQRKNFGVGAQARNYFGNAVLSGLLMKSDHEGARVVLAFPTQKTFRGLARRAGGPLLNAGIEVWLVDEDGYITENIGAERRSSKFEWHPEDVVLLSSDDEEQ